MARRNQAESTPIASRANAITRALFPLGVQGAVPQISVSSCPSGRRFDLSAAFWQDRPLADATTPWHRGGDRSAESGLRPAAPAGHGCSTARHLASVVGLGGDRARAGAAGRGRNCRDPPARPRPRQRAARTAWPAPGDSAIVPVAAEGGMERLRAAGIKGSVRAGAVRLSFPLHDTEADVDAVARVLGC
jgi:hypothetical protein